MPIPLTRRFFARPSDVVARRLLGATLACGPHEGMIVETEAYGGPEDLASHARFGQTERTRVMFGPAGQSYVYLCYGVHELFNVVTGKEGEGQAVLIRALAPLGALGDDPAVARGPGKLTRALGITRAMSPQPVTGGGDVTVARGRRVTDEAVSVGPRIGVDYAGKWASAPLRFWLTGHPSVTKAR